eukprot:XP_011668725.1 PREDICTED: monocarboxylate transporter 9 isoform X1 [Strongylocentrotus purpuratus]
METCRHKNIIGTIVDVRERAILIHRTGKRKRILEYIYIVQSSILITHWGPFSLLQRRRNLMMTSPGGKLPLCQRLRPPWRWVVVGASFFIYTVLYGILYSYNVLFIAFREEFNSSYTVTGWIGSVSIGLSLLIAPLVNILTERFGCRPVAIIGTIVAASALIVTSFLKSLIAVFIAYGLVFGVGGGLMTVCCYDAVLLYFPEENNVRAMGLLLTGTSFGLLSFTPLMSFIISRYGWRVLLRIVGPLLLFVGLPCALTFVEPSHPSGDRKHQNGDKNIIYLRNEEEIAEISELMDDSKMLKNSPKPLSVNEKSQCSQSGDEKRVARVPVKFTRMNNEYDDINDKDITSSRERFPTGFEDDLAESGDPCRNGEMRWEDKTRPVRTASDQSITRKILVALTFPELWLISISTVLNGIGDCFYLVNWTNYMVSVGFPEPTGVRVVSLLGFSNLIGKIGMSVIGEYIPFPRVFLLVISSVVSIAVMLVILFTRNVIIMYYIAVVVGGVTMTTTNTITYSLASEFFGPERALETSGVILFAYGSGYVLGSLVGQSIDTTGSYTYAIWAFIGMYTVSGLCVLMAPVYQRFFAPHRLVTFELYRKKMEARKNNVVSEQKSFGCEENSLKGSTIVYDRETCV